MKTDKGRPRVGKPLCVTLTAAQRAWLERRVAPSGGSLASAVRALIASAMVAEAAMNHPRRAG